jgi:hypothetical protein
MYYEEGREALVEQAHVLRFCAWPAVATGDARTTAGKGPAWALLGRGAHEGGKMGSRDRDVDGGGRGGVLER